jgi:hypothetical protein
MLNGVLPFPAKLPHGLRRLSIPADVYSRFNRTGELTMDTNDAANRLLKESDAASYLQISRSTLRQQRMKRRTPSGIPLIPFVRFGRNIRYDIRVLDSVIETATVLPETASGVVTNAETGN